MLKYGNKDFRNIQEQVAKNMNDIDWLINYKGALNEFGIKVVGQGPLFENSTPDAGSYNPGDVICVYSSVLDEYLVYTCYYDEESAQNEWSTNISVYKEFHEGWEYGDAWIFGSEAPYEMFILTRSNGSNPTDYFLPVGEFPIPGPQGEQGVQGPVGNTPNVSIVAGSISTLNPDQSATASIVKSGTVTDPVFTLNLGLPKGAKGNTGNTGPQGPQGVQGPKGDKGDKGDQGGLIDIVGIVEDASELPDPETLQKLDAAYLVGTSPDYELYIQVGETPATAVWTNLGIMNEGSIITVNGNPQPTWEANTKVSVYTDGAVNTIYAVNAGGSSAYHLPYGSGLVANGVVLRDASYQITVPETPTANGQAASKKYVDTTVANKVPLAYQGDILVGGSGGASSRLAIGSAGQVLSVNSGGNGLEYKSVSTVPAYESSDNGKALLVNSTGTGLEWGTVSGGGGGSTLYAHYVYAYTSGEKIRMCITIINTSSTVINSNSALYDAINYNGGPTFLSSRPINCSLTYIDSNGVAHTSLSISLRYANLQKYFAISSWETGAYNSLNNSLMFNTDNDIVVQIN